MTTFDFSPLFRSTIGFDRLASLFEEANRAGSEGFPPYNIELTGEDHYRITMAVAGFGEDELELEAKENVLRISGRKADADTQRKYLYRGIATRSFERRYQLADYVRVDAARLENGLLHIDLVREIPEAMKPRKIAISSGQAQTAIEGRVDVESQRIETAGARKAA